jgi:hypothetical protein
MEFVLPCSKRVDRGLVQVEVCRGYMVPERVLDVANGVVVKGVLCWNVA